MLTETQVRAAVLRWLYRHGWGYPDPKEKRQHGPDIRVRHTKYPRYFIIETKGDPSRKTSAPDSSKTVNFWTAIGQIITRMNTLSRNHYGIAFPLSYHRKIKNLPWRFCRKNQLFVFLVGNKDKVKCLTWKELRAMP